MTRAATKRFLTNLLPEETAEVLKQLLANRPDLESDAVAIAESLLLDVDCVDVANQVAADFGDMDIGDLYAGAGKSLQGYTDETEALWQNLEVKMGPFLEDIRRRVAVGLEDCALEQCKGVVLGCYRLAQESSSEAVSHAPDWPSEAADEAVRVWQTTQRPRQRGSAPKGSTRRALPDDFLCDAVPDWRDWLAAKST